MKVEFCMYDGEVLYTQDSDEIKDILNVITRENSEINLYFGKDDFYHGYVDNVLYSVDGSQDDDECILKIFMKEYQKSELTVTNKLLKEINDKI